MKKSVRFLCLGLCFLWLLMLPTSCAREEVPSSPSSSPPAARSTNAGMSGGSPSPAGSSPEKTSDGETESPLTDKTTKETQTDLTPENDLTLTEEDMELFDNSYRSLLSRVTDRGYAQTSLNGVYNGMFTRDSAIQIMAHTALRDYDAARSVLRYLLSFHATLGLRRATHIIDEIREDDQGLSYIGDAAPDPFLSQRRAETPLYSVVAPAHAAALPFVPADDEVYAVQAHLTKTADTDAVRAQIRTDYRDPASCVGEALYVFGKHESGWQRIDFETPVRVTPGKTYYLVLQTVKAAGNVAWNGTTAPQNGVKSYNYDTAAFGGWTEQSYRPAFEILPCAESAAALLPQSGGAALGAEARIFSYAAQGFARFELRTDVDDPQSSLRRVEVPIGSAGEQTLRFSFEALRPQSGQSLYAVCTLHDTPGAHFLCDGRAAGRCSIPGEGGYTEIKQGVSLTVFREEDRAPLLELGAGDAGLQQIPADGRTVTSVRVLLRRGEQTSGTVRATLIKGEGENAVTVSVKTLPVSELQTEPAFILFRFDLPLQKIPKKGDWFLRVEAENAQGVYLCGSTEEKGRRTAKERCGVQSELSGEIGFEALCADLRVISDYEQTDTTFMLIHAWTLFADRCRRTEEDLAFLEQSYPTIKTFADYYFESGHFNKKLGLLRNDSLEHSRKGRYWIAYDLITNVFASQALRELGQYAQNAGDGAAAERWTNYARRLERGINEHLTAEIDGLRIYGEFYAVEEDMKFYPGFSWVNLAPVAAEWYGTNAEIMENTFALYKKYATVKMNGYEGLATDADYPPGAIRRELIGKGVAWELMYRLQTGDTARVREILDLENETARRCRLRVYPESWIGQNAVSDPGNQEHCAWQVYAISRLIEKKIIEDP